MAPEVFRHESYNEQVDVYSFAMILYYLTVGKPPWPSLPGYDAAWLASEEGNRPIIPRIVDAHTVELLQSCWHGDPNTRPSFRKILALLHTYMEDTFHSDMNSVTTAISPELSPLCTCVIL